MENKKIKLPGKKEEFKTLNDKFLKAEKLADVVTTELDIPKRSTIGEYVMVMHLSGSKKIRAKTGTVNYSQAQDLAYEGILFVEENFGPVLFWNWEGEESVIRTVKNSFPIKNEEKQQGILAKLSSFINGSDETEVERIRRRNARKEKIAAFKGKVDAFFSFEDEDEEEYYQVPADEAKPKTVKEKIVRFFFEVEEDKTK